jgi:putative transposase
MLQDRFGVSERWACRVVGQHRSTQRHQPDRVDADAVLRGLLREISAQRPRWATGARMSASPSSGMA